MSNIAAVPSHVAGDTFTAGMWTTLQQNLNDGVVNQVCAARVYSTNNVTTNATLAPITFNAERYDGDSIHDLVTNPSYLTAKTAGIYHIGGNVEWPTDASAGRVYVAIRLNGSTIIAKEGGTANSGGLTPKQVFCDWLLNANDYVELLAASVNDLTLQADSDYSPEFWMHRV